MEQGFGIGKQLDLDLISTSVGYNVSERYIPVQTKEVIKILADQAGFTPVGFDAVNVRKQEKQGFQKHMVMLEEPDADMIDGKLRIVLYNSYDRTTPIKIFLGYYRDACSNDCVWGNDIMEPISIKHTNKDWRQAIDTTVNRYRSAKQSASDNIDRMMNTYMSYGDQGKFSEYVASHIYTGSGIIVDPLEFNVAQRQEDLGKDLWHTYQRIQSNLLNGGINRIIDHGDTKKISKTHKVTSIDEKIKLNQQLNEFALKFK